MLTIHIWMPFDKYKDDHRQEVLDELEIIWLKVKENPIMVVTFS